MKILPGRIEKYFVGKVAEKNKRDFRNEHEKIISYLQEYCTGKESLKVKVVSFIGEVHKLDQLYSLASFYINVGIPSEWLIISDGSYQRNKGINLESIPGVKVMNWNDNNEVTYDTLLLFGQYTPFGKRLHAYINQPLDMTTVFTDADILFFPGLKNTLAILKRRGGNWYMLDHGPTYMEPYYWEKINKQLKHYLNAGLLVFNHKPDWNVAVDYICNRKDFSAWGNYTEQVAVNLMLDRDANSFPLDKEVFIFNNTDCFHLYHKFDYNKISLRHFAGSQARIKMWQLNWKRVLKLENDF